MYNRKSQIEITNVLFMHLIGLIGILTFTFLFVSLITSSSSRAEGLKTDTLYYNYGRRLISSSDCFAFQYTKVYYSKSGIDSFSRIMPGVIDMSKIFDYNYRNCLKYDLVSGAATADPDNPYASYPVVFYEITVKDDTSNVTFVTKQDGGTTSQSMGVFTASGDVFVSATQGKTYTICAPPEGCPAGCMYDCSELAKYVDSKDSAKICAGDARSLENVNPGVNCWTDEFNNIARIVEPYSESESASITPFNCSLPLIAAGTTSESGNVFEKTLSYPVILRYPGVLKDYENYDAATFEDLKFVEHVGTFTVKFCVIKVPTMCDPFFRYTYMDTLGGELFNNPVFNPDVCAGGGLPQI